MLLAPNRTITIVIYLFILLASLCVSLLYQAVTMSDTIATSPSRMPVYFLSIGKPNFMENTQHPAYAKLGEVGREITTKVKPKAVVGMIALPLYALKCSILTFCGSVRSKEEHFERANCPGVSLQQ
jgi:hypothetical protein